MEEAKISYIDRIKGLVDKSQALVNGVIQNDFNKVKNVLDEAPGLLTGKHLQLSEMLGERKTLTPEQQIQASVIKSELNYVAEKNYAEFYVNKNNLSIDNPNEALKHELSIDPPTHKEPIIHYLAKGGDITLLTNDNLNKKIQDLSIGEIGGRKIIEKDKEILVNFAAYEAIKRNDVTAYKHLDKEFNITDGIKSGLSSGVEHKALIEAHKADKILNYVSELAIGNKNSLNEFALLREDLRTDNTQQNSNKLDALAKTKELIVAISNKNIKGITKAVVEGADHKLIDYKQHIQNLDPKDQMEIMYAVKNGIQERNAKFDFSRTIDLQAAAVKGDALKAYNAITNGADPKGITKGTYSHLGPDERKAFENAIVKAVLENNKKQSQNLTQKEKPGIKFNS